MANLSICIPWITGGLPSGYVEIAIENHRFSRKTGKPTTNCHFQKLCTKLPEGTIHIPFNHYKIPLESH